MTGDLLSILAYTVLKNYRHQHQSLNIPRSARGSVFAPNLIADEVSNLAPIQ